MVARVNTVAFQGIDVLDVDVQVQTTSGLPAADLRVRCQLHIYGRPLRWMNLPLHPAAGFDVSASTPSCAICLDEEKLACCVWSACGHRCACLDCARKCTALGSSSRCPICRVAGVPIAVRDVQRARA